MVTPRNPWKLCSVSFFFSFTFAFIFFSLLPSSRPVQTRSENTFATRWTPITWCESVKLVKKPSWSDPTAIKLDTPCKIQSSITFWSARGCERVPSRMGNSTASPRLHSTPIAAAATRNGFRGNDPRTFGPHLPHLCVCVCVCVRGFSTSEWRRVVFNLEPCFYLTRRPVFHHVVPNSRPVVRRGIVHAVPDHSARWISPTIFR